MIGFKLETLLSWLEQSQLEGNEFMRSENFLFVLELSRNKELYNNVENYN